jgi:hypothetical protein
LKQGNLKQAVVTLENASRELSFAPGSGAANKQTASKMLSEAGGYLFDAGEAPRASELKLRAGDPAAIVGRSSAINQVRTQLERVAPTGSRVLLQGRSLPAPQTFNLPVGRQRLLFRPFRQKRRSEQLQLDWEEPCWQDVLLWPWMRYKGWLRKQRRWRARCRRHCAVPNRIVFYRSSIDRMFGCHVIGGCVANCPVDYVV